MPNLENLWPDFLKDSVLVQVLIKSPASIRDSYKNISKHNRNVPFYLFFFSPQHSAVQQEHEQNKIPQAVTQLLFVLLQSLLLPWDTS